MISLIRTSGSRRRWGHRAGHQSQAPYKLAEMTRITDYSFGHIVVDGCHHDRDVIVLPDRVVGDWWRNEGHSLTMEDLEEVLEGLPPRLIVGCGAHGRLVPEPSSLVALRDRGIEVEVARTGEAVDRYNASDTRTTAAALHLTC
jgi:hypothetical protein